MGEANGRERAWKLLQEHVKDDGLLRHCVTVEAAMRYFSTLFPGEDQEKWGVVGLLHDIDYEQFPDEHCAHTRPILEPAGYPEEVIRAIESHGFGLVNEIEPKTDLEKSLYTVDELSGLIYAVALLRPSKSLDDLTVKSVKKKWKQNGFAAGCNREVILKGVQMLGMSLEDVIAHTIEGMRPVEVAIGLAQCAPV